MTERATCSTSDEAETFKLTLGPKRHCAGALRSPLDYTREVLVDFDTLPGASLGFVTVFHELHGSRVDGWYIFDTTGDDLPWVNGWHETLSSAMSAAKEVVERHTGRAHA